jgi:flagellar motor protein MotB
MANQKASPVKFLSFLFGGAQRRREQRAANEDMGNQMDAWEDTKMTNPYAGVKNPYADMENVYEDATVNLKAAEFAKEQSQQSMADIMANMKTSAGGSGVAGLAQVLANQGAKQAQQAAVSIGQQEQANQARARGEAGRLQQLEREGEQKRDLMEREGERMVEKFAFDKQDKMLGWAMDRKAAADQKIANAEAQMDQFITGAANMGMAAMTGGASTAFTGSDIRLKENINKTGVSKSGIPIYTFNYKGEDKLWSGTMAQDLLNMGREDAVTVMDNGYYAVHYDMIDVDMVVKN